MNTRKLAFCALAILFIFNSCDNRRKLFDEYQKFGEEMIWYKSDVRTFTIDVKENKHPFELCLSLRYITSYPYDKILLQVVETDPQGNSIRRDVDVQVRDEKGNFIGEKGFDIIDIEYVLDAKKGYPTFGKYKYEITQAMPDIDPLAAIMGVGLILRDPEE